MVSVCRVDEAHLTGESEEVSKDPCSRQAMYSGSKLLSGVGKMIVTAVGRRSQSGIISEMILGGEMKEALPLKSPTIATALKEETVLQKRLANYATQIGKFGVASAVFTTLVLATTFSYHEFFLAQNPWNFNYLERYLQFFITGVTILVRMYDIWGW